MHPVLEPLGFALSPERYRPIVFTVFGKSWSLEPGPRGGMLVSLGRLSSSVEVGSQDHRWQYMEPRACW